MARFTRQPASQNTISVAPSPSQEPPFVVELKGDDAEGIRWFRVSHARRPAGQDFALLDLHGAQEVPASGTFRIVPPKRIVVEQLSKDRFSARVDGHGVEMTSNLLEGAMHSAFFLSDTYGGDEPEPGPGVTTGDVARGKVEWEIFERFVKRKP